MRRAAGSTAVKVYLDDCGDKRLIGRVDVPDGHGPVYEVPLFGAASVIVEQFTVGTVTHLPEGSRAPVVERAVLVAPGQVVELLPGWQPLAS
jgi:hypothetical protein